MHYRNGRPAQNGDKIITFSPYAGHPTVGVLINARPGNDDCNGHIATVPAYAGVNLRECLHLEDVLGALGDLDAVKRTDR